MNDTYLTVVGNLVTVPERRRVESTGATVVNFRLGSTARRFDKASGGWVDGNTFFVKVSCWRGLADNVYQSLFKGDPVVVHGRLYTREYQAEDGTRRTSYELEATAVGHNLARGASTFNRTRPGQASGTAEHPDDAPDGQLAAVTDADADVVGAEVFEGRPTDAGDESYPFARLGEPAAGSAE